MPKRGKALKPAKLAKPGKKQAAPTDGNVTLTGWQQIAAFLGHPTAVVQRWAGEGMPVRRQGRFVTTTPDELNSWLGRESGKPVHVATENTDLAAELKRGLSFLRNQKGEKGQKAIESAHYCGRCTVEVEADSRGSVTSFPGTPDNPEVPYRV